MDAQYFSPAAGLFRRGDLVFCAITRAGSARTGALLVVAAGDGRVLLEPLQAPVAAPLSSLQGVEVSGAAPGDVLTFSDGTWTNRPAAGHAGDVHAALHGNPHATTADEVGAIAASERGRPGGIATLDGDGLLSAAQLRQVALANLRDVVAANPKIGDVLQFNGSAWTSGPATGVAGDAFAAAHAGSGGSAHAAATASAAGFMAAADKAKLDRIEPGARADQTGTEMVKAIDAELGGADWRQGSAAWGSFCGKSLGPTLVESNGAMTSTLPSYPERVL